MTTATSIKERYERIYTPLIKQFAKDTAELNPHGITEPHLPLCGNRYDTQSLKVAFIGMETRTWGNMSAFLKDATEDPIRASHRIQNEFDNFDFADPSTNWGTKSPSSFQSTILRYLASIHGIEKWTTLKSRKPESVLASHLWANVNSLERFSVTAARKKGNKKDWIGFKKASSAFDSLDLVLEAFMPDLAIIMCSNVPVDYYPQGIVLKQVEGYLNYGFHEKTKTHIYKTSHPGWLNRKSLLSRKLDVLIEKGKEIRELKQIEMC